MKVLAVRPSGLMYTRVFLRLEPLGRRRSRRQSARLGTRSGCPTCKSNRIAIWSVRFVRMLWRFNSVFNPNLQLNDHAREVRYAMTPPAPPTGHANVKVPYVHGPAGRKGRKGRKLDDATESFVDQTRMGAG